MKTVCRVCRRRVDPLARRVRFLYLDGYQGREEAFLCGRRACAIAYDGEVGNLAACDCGLHGGQACAAATRGAA